MKKVILSLFTLLAAATLATAQMRPSVKVEAGLNLSQQQLSLASRESKGDVLPINVDWLAGYRIGLGVELDLKNGFYFNPGLYFLSRGFRRVDISEMRGNRRDETPVITSKTSNTLWLHNIEMPLHLGYRVPISSEMTLSLQAGPWLSYGFSAKRITRTDISNDRIRDNYPSYDYNDTNARETTSDPYKAVGKELKPFDLGLGVQGALEYRQVGINLGFERGLLNTCFREVGEVYNMNLYVGLGYRF